LNAMAMPAAFDPGPLVILLRFRTVAKVDSIVILSFGLGHGCDLRVCVEDGVADAAQRGVLRRFRRGGLLPKGDPRVRCGVFVGRCAGRRARARVVA
jgi:hypothetical protein